MRGSVLSSLCIRKGDFAEALVLAKLRDPDVFDFEGVEFSPQRFPSDIMVKDGNRVFHVQVKTAHYDKKRDCWLVAVQHQVNKKRELYATGLFDYLVVYIPGCAALYVFPASLVLNKNSLYFYPHRQQKNVKNFFGEDFNTDDYREAWNILKEVGSHVD